MTGQSANAKHAQRVRAVLDLFRGDAVAAVSRRYGIGRSDVYKFRCRALTALNPKFSSKLPHARVSHPSSPTSASTPRGVSDLAVSICAVLIAEACNIGLEPLVRAELPALRRARLSWVNQNFIRDETLTDANACLVGSPTPKARNPCATRPIGRMSNLTEKVKRKFRFNAPGTTGLPTTSFRFLKTIATAEERDGRLIITVAPEGV